MLDGKNSNFVTDGCSVLCCSLHIVGCCNVRSTPCSLVKHDEEWGELCACEAGEHCGSSHTRTEQQFHPEVEHFISVILNVAELLLH